MFKKSSSKFPIITVLISILLGCMFLGFFYLAVTQEPEYMPSYQKKMANQ
ncbi:hypothetical protein [Acinetobacter radioresistens]|nr:hypothetical protein [Acinetobacter radioresistens]